MKKELDIQQFHTVREIIICTKCKGSGIYTWEEIVDYHRGDKDIHEETCATCNGTGRLVRIKKWLEWTEPFDTKTVAWKNMRRSLKTPS